MFVSYFVQRSDPSVHSRYAAARDMTDDAIKKFAFGNKLTATVLRDSDGAATLKKFNVEQVPSFVILDKNGKQIGDVFGGIDPKYDVTIPISKAIDKIL